MAEPEASNTFNRGTRLRASLPVVRSTNQTKDRSLGVLYLQYGDEVTQFAMPNEITTMDTVHALFVRAFPKQLTMKMLESQNVAVYIKDEARNVFYELSDLRSIQDRALLKVYHKDPAHISLNHSSRAVNGDVRMQREMVHTKDAPPSFRHHGPLPHGPPSSPPIPQSMPPSPSRIPYNGGRTIPMPGSATVPRDRLSNMPPSRSISPSPSAILERRDVKPDEDLSGKNVALFRNEGLYADPYMYLDGRMSIASSSTGIPGDVPDHILYHRPSLRSGNTYPSTNVQADLMEQSLYRIKPRKYSDSYIPSIVSKTPPPSPQKISEMRIMDIHGQSSHLSHPVQLDRSCSIRSSLRKDSGTSIAMEAAAIKARSAASSPSVSDVIPFSADKQMSGYSSTSATPNDPETRERMKAMEKQIASLTGLVQSALFKGGNNAKEVPGEKIKATPLSSSEAQGATSAVALKSSGITSDSSSVVQPSPSCQQQIQNNVFDLRRNIFDLRQQLQHLRQSQLENQEMLRAMFKKAESEINSRVIEAMKRTEDPLQRQRIMVEEERQKYLVDEEKIVQQLCGLEKSIDGLSKDASSTQQTITLKDVEEGAVALRQVGECLAGLKAEFPTLQNKMRAVLRVEVEAVKFLKEEPHKLESLLKRVKSMTEVLTGLRRLVTEDLSRGTESKPSLQKSITETVTTVSESEMSKDSPLQVQEYTNFVQATGPQSPSGSLHEVQNSVVKSESHMVVHQVQSSPVQIHQSHHSSVLLHPTQGPLIMPKQSQNAPVTVQQVQSSPAVTKRTQESTDGITPIQSAPGHQFQSSSSTTQVSSGQNLFIDEIHAASTKKGIHRKMTIEAAEREWEEKRQNMNQYDEKEFERLLEEAQANMMKGIPSLEVEPEQKSITKLEEPDGLKQPEEIILPEQGNEKSMKSPPPPPPPRRFYPPGSGLTTTRSGEVIFTARKEGNPVTPEENSSAPLKSPRSPVEVKELALTSAPVEASAVKEDEDEGDRIMAELQAFQKCSVTDVSSKTVVEQPKVEIQAKDVRSTALLSAKEKKQRSGIADEQAIAMESEDQALLDSTVIPNDAPMTSNVFIFHNVHSQIELQSLNDTSVPSTYPKDTSKYLENEETPMPNKMHVHQSVVKEQNSTREREYVSAVEKKESDTDFKTESELKHFISPCTKLSTPQVNISTSEEVVGQNILSPLMRAQMTVPAGQHCTTILDQHDSVSNKFGHQGWEMPSADQSYQKESYSQQVILRPKNKGTVRYLEDVDSSSSSGEDSPSSDNIAFMITNTEVQALSSGEVIDLVNKKGEDIQTLNVDANREMTAGQEAGCEDSMLFTDKKPVIIIFDEPMDIRSAYKRLSTVFEECDEDLERMMAEERIDEESEVVEHSNDTKTLSESGMNNDELHSNRISSTPDLANNSVCNKSSGHDHDIQLSSAEINAPKESKSDPIESDDTKSDCAESLLTNKADNKKKFKFKFPKKQLAALTQAIKTGTKTGKKTLQVVVYEDEEELDGTVKQHKEAKRFEIVQANCKDEASTKTMQSKQHNSTDVIPNSFRTDQIRKNTYKTLDSLEQTIKQLETTISEMSPKEEDYINYPSQSSELSQGAMSWNEIKSTEQLLLSSAKAPQNTKTKPPLLPKISTKTSESQSSHLMSPSSRMPVSVGSKLRHQQGTTEKVTKQKLQDPQRQFRQANGSAKKAGGESKVTSPTLPASKIPALSSSSGKSSSVPGPSNDNTNHLNTSSKYPLSAANSVAPTAGRNVQIPSVSHIPSTSNGSLKLHAQNSALTGRGQPLSFPLHTPNGRPSPSSSSPSTSPVSPTSLTQGAKSIRTIHTASFASYKQQNVNQSKFTMAAVKETA